LRKGKGKNLPKENPRRAEMRIYFRRLTGGPFLLIGSPDAAGFHPENEERRNILEEEKTCTH